LARSEPVTTTTLAGLHVVRRYEVIPEIVLAGGLGLFAITEPHAAASAFKSGKAIALMAEHPALMQRPVVVRGERAVLARPVERVLELLA